MISHAMLVRHPRPAEYQHPEAVDTIVAYEPLAQLGVGEAAVIQTRLHRRPPTGQTQVLVVSTERITVEAENALLKVLEEPPADTAVVLVVPPAVRLLATLQSRFVEQVTVAESADGTAWAAFLAAPVIDRLAAIDAWQKSKDATWLAAIQQGFLGWLAGATPDPQLQLVATRLGTRGASNKMLLEQLALTLPLQNR